MNKNVLRIIFLCIMLVLFAWYFLRHCGLSNFNQECAWSAWTMAGDYVGQHLRKVGDSLLESLPGQQPTTGEVALSP